MLLKVGLIIVGDQRSKEGKVLSDFFLLFVCYKYLKGVLGGRFVGVVKRTEMLQPLFYKTTL